ncbi:hypothetical protein P9775_006278 [Pseudomonas aeruginosa]|nr:hypothetical protein [Pseudomonas aeruginosa]
MKVLDYGAERKWQGLSALSVPLLPKPHFQVDAVEFSHGALFLLLAILVVQTTQYCRNTLVNLEQKTSTRSLY